jgi:hypothetical protein
MGGLTTQGSTGIRVFLVDDHPAMLDAIGRALAEAPKRPATAPSGTRRARSHNRNLGWSS